MPESVEPSPTKWRREVVLLVAAWLILAFVVVLLAR
jgi:hypothetical protein